MLKRPPLNNQIRAKEVRTIDEEGKQLGVISLEEALRIAGERNLDLIQISEKAVPPVCKIMEYGKYLYWQRKKAKEATKHKTSETKIIQLTFNISPHDLETKADQSKKFLEKGNRIIVVLVLRGREKALADFAKGKISQFLETLNKKIPVKTERDLRRDPRGFSMVIAKA
ncbi:MAG: translation initiation factor IF-3 [Candidatus Nealsonbacteria bacterium]